MSWVEKNRKINNRGGGGTIIQDSRVSAYEYINCLIQPILSFLEVVSLYNIIKKKTFRRALLRKCSPVLSIPSDFTTVKPFKH